VWDYYGTMYSDYTYSMEMGYDWAAYGATLSYEETISLGIQTFEKELDGVLIWEGSRTEVDAFEFADGVSINVINVSSENIAGDPVFDTVGTEGVDLIFGSAADDLIDGKGGDDIIFGGEGDDVIIGGEGDDVIIGGDGADILRGDGVDGNDAAVSAWKTAAGEFNSANSDNTIVFDENMLSLDNGGPSTGDGNDVIIGGDGLDDIKSGDGKNFVTSGKADIDGDGQANLDLINQNIEDHQYLLDDEDWV
jgi:Ca2+-binding RTX toxin-like protein